MILILAAILLAMYTLSSRDKFGFPIGPFADSLRLCFVAVLTRGLYLERQAQPQSWPRKLVRIVIMVVIAFIGLGVSEAVTMFAMWMIAA